MDRADYFIEPADGVELRPFTRADIAVAIAMAKRLGTLAHGPAHTDHEVALAVDRDWLGHPRPYAGAVDDIE